MLNSARKIIAATALTGVLVVAVATPSEARWFGRGWGWGAPVAAGVGIGLAGAAIASAAASPGYYVYSGYPAYDYGYDYGYPAYGYSYGGPAYVSYGYDVDYGYGGYAYRAGPVAYASYGWGGYDYEAGPAYGYAYTGPSYSTRSYAYGTDRGYRQTYAGARRTVAASSVQAPARSSAMARSYGERGQRYAQVGRSSRVVETTQNTGFAQRAAGAQMTGAGQGERVSKRARAPQAGGVQAGSGMQAGLRSGAAAAPGR